MRTSIMTIAAASTLAMTAACGSDAAPDNDTVDATETTATQDGNQATGTYADGTFDATGSYSNPSGQSTVSVEVTLGDAGIIKSVTVTPQATNATSKQFQTAFASGIADQIVGKKIDDLDVDKVAGSSLTHAGFNQAIETIKDDARA